MLLRPLCLKLVHACIFIPPPVHKIAHHSPTVGLLMRQYAASMGVCSYDPKSPPLWSNVICSPTGVTYSCGGKSSRWCNTSRYWYLARPLVAPVQLSPYWFDTKLIGDSVLVHVIFILRRGIKNLKRSFLGLGLMLNECEEQADRNERGKQSKIDLEREKIVNEENYLLRHNAV